MEDIDEHGEDDTLSDDNTLSDDDESTVNEDELRHREELRRRVERNDPTLLGILINERSLPHNGDWDQFGASIGGNRFLREITFTLRSRRVGSQFFRGVALNRTIEKLSLVGCYEEDEEMFESLIPFFKSNQAFQCLCVENKMGGDICLGTLTRALTQFDSLKEFEINDEYNIDEENELLEALAGHVGLRKISIRSIPIEINGFKALAALLRNPRSNIKVLYLEENETDDERAKILSLGLSRNSTLAELNLSGNRNIQERGWQAIFEVLKNPHCRLDKLHLSHNYINDTVAFYLANAMRNNTTLKTLFLNSIDDITIAGWQNLFAALLQSPNCTLEELYLDGNEFYDDIIESLTTAIANNRRLRVLNLSNNRGVTAMRWEAFSVVLQNPMLEKLDLSKNSMGDHVMVSLADALANNTRLRELNLGMNRHVTTMGWQALSILLKSPNTELEKLDMTYNDITDHVVFSFSDALAENNYLKELIFDDHRITPDGYAAFTRILCNKSTILNTYNSNHTLEKFGNEEKFYRRMLPEDLRSLLRINRENSKSQAARLKIFTTHFRGSEINLQTFAEMDTRILPAAVAWMAKGEYVDSSELSLVYRFIRSVPTLLEK